MTWLVTETQFDLVVGSDGCSLHGYTHKHEWIAYGEALSREEHAVIASYPLQWEIRAAGLDRVKNYVELDGAIATAGIATAVRVPNNAIIVVAEIARERWPTFLRGFETYAAASYPKHFRINIPFDSLSSRNLRSVALEQFLSGDLVNQSVEEVSAVFLHGSDLPEHRVP